jgi:hypothetical protein
MEHIADLLSLKGIDLDKQVPETRIFFVYLLTDPSLFDQLLTYTHRYPKLKNKLRFYETVDHFQDLLKEQGIVFPTAIERFLGAPMVGTWVATSEHYALLCDIFDSYLQSGSIFDIETSVVEIATALQKGCVPLLLFTNLVDLILKDIYELVFPDFVEYLDLKAIVDVDNFSCASDDSLDYTLDARQLSRNRNFGRSVLSTPAKNFVFVATKQKYPTIQQYMSEQNSKF